jgi:hypothetical protein
LIAGVTVLFAGLSMGTKIGIQAKWISTYLNFIVGDILRLKKGMLVVI